VGRDCPMRSACKICGMQGHMARLCPAKTCDICGRVGHERSDCQRRQSGQGTKCYECGQLGEAFFFSRPVRAECALKGEQVKREGGREGGKEGGREGGRSSLVLWRGRMMPSSKRQNQGPAHAHLVFRVAATSSLLGEKRPVRPQS
jgi:hypothetical protein